MKAVTVIELETYFDDLLDLAEDGKEIIVTRKGREIARLLPPRGRYEDVLIPQRGFGQ